MSRGDGGSEICSRCLVILDARSSVRVINGLEDCAAAPNPANPRSLRRWVEEHMWGHGDRLAVNDMADAFDVVGTWGGDPLCSGHMIEAAMEHYRDRPAR